MFKVLTKGCEPTRGSKYSACVDLYASEDVVIGAGETKLIGLGVAIDFETFMDDYPHILKPCGDTWLDFMASHYLQLMLRSSLSKELVIANGVGVIDLDYEDEIKIRLHNPIKGANELGHYETYSQIKKGQKIAQITLLEHKSYLFGIDSDVERSGGFGSTDAEVD